MAIKNVEYMNLPTTPANILKNNSIWLKCSFKLITFYVDATTSHSNHHAEKSNSFSAIKMTSQCELKLYRIWNDI